VSIADLEKLKGVHESRNALVARAALDVAMGKTIVLQLSVPQESTVALLKRLGGKEGPGPRGARPPAAP
jgi:hypothetical protein